MKSTTVAFGLFAGIASASYNHPRHFHNPYWRRNETAPSTTLTVAVTSVHTITSCAPTITNCPANAGNGTGAVVTEVIDLTTTVCPVTAIGSISSSLVGAHSSGLIPGSTRTVIPTATSSAAAEGTTPASGGVSVYPSFNTVPQTVTMTVGPESSRSVLVTTIQSTQTQMVTVTAVPVSDLALANVLPAPSPSPKPSRPPPSTSLPQPLLLRLLVPRLSLPLSPKKAPPSPRRAPPASSPLPLPPPSSLTRLALTTAPRLLTPAALPSRPSSCATKSLKFRWSARTFCIYNTPNCSIA
ncbi:hypothetical protein F4804DRAFT_31047 [Jackrogersella minutella]|nr:hypothetical protein F4804DRAFT_31047 [Jackrogersella minutella]